MFKKGFKFTILSFLLVPVFASNAFAFESVQFAIKEICGHMQGNLGGLLMTVAAIGGITAAAFGNLRASHGMIVVGVGAAALSAVLSLYFPKAAEICAPNGALQPGANTINGFEAPVDNPGRGGANVGRLATIADLAQAKAFNDAAVAIASGKEADFTNHVDLQQTDAEFDPNLDEVTDGF